MKPSPAFQFYPADFLMGTALFSCEEVGAYLRLLCHQWHSHGLPDDNRMLSRLAGCDVEVIEKLASKFQRCGDGLLRNPRLEEVRAKQEAYRESRSESGKKGGRPKKHTVLKPKANGKHTESSLSLSLSPSLTATSEHPSDVGAKASRPPLMDDGEWLQSLAKDGTYEGIDVIREHGKMARWCEVNRKQPTRRRFTNWLNRVDKPLGAASKTKERAAKNGW